MPYDKKPCFERMNLHSWYRKEFLPCYGTQTKSRSPLPLAQPFPVSYAGATIVSFAELK